MVNRVLLLTIDSLRADHFPLPGRTPTFRALQKEGTRLQHAFATGPGTTSSFPALLTGSLPLSYGGLGALSSARPRVAIELQDIGLRTAGFHSNPFLSTHFNYDVGFRIFEDYQNPLMGLATKVFPRGAEINQPIIKKLDDILNITGFLKRTYQAISGKSRPYVSAEVITEDVIRWLKGSESPFFCWAHYMDVHHPCLPPSDIRRKYGLEDVTAADVSEWYSTALESPGALSESQQEKFKNLSEAAIEYTDKEIGRIVDYLKATGEWEDTLVILTSDHGALFREYGSYGKPIRMYDELVRVPLVIINGPTYLNHLDDSLVSLLDVPPLIHDAFDAKIPSAYEGILPDHPGYRDHVMFEHQVAEGVVIGARSGDLLYEYNGIRDEQGFFKVAPGTFQSIPEPQQAGRLEAIVQKRLAAADATVNAPDLDRNTEERLEDLGYL